MKPLLTIFASLLLIQAVSAQSDSGYYDIGRMQLKKEFTQVTIIEAADLARIPFLSVSDVIRSRANGALTQKDQMVYVVDGITVTDIDAYNIQDIGDITIIRNALANQNGAGNLQLLALVRTKQWKEGAKHIMFSAMGAALHRKVVTKISGHNQQTEHVFSGNFQQYALTLRGGNQQISYGGSISFVHDALPRGNNKDSLYDKKIPGIDRIKLNLWAKFVLNKNNVLSGHFNYVPQVEASHRRETDIYQYTDDIIKDREYWVNPYISLETRIPDFLFNRFTLSYVNGRILDSTNIRTERDDLRIRNNRSKDSTRAEVIQFNDNLAFVRKAGNWQIEPSLNINFQKAFYRRAEAAEDYWENPFVYHSYSYSISSRLGQTLTATPSLAVSYGSFFLLQGGVLLDGSKFIESGYQNTRSYPFLNGAVNLAGLLKQGASFDWKISGSYSERFSGLDGIFQVSDFNHSLVLPKALVPDPYSLGVPSTIPPENTFATQWQVGTSISILKERIRINYNYLQVEERQLIRVSLPPTVPMPDRIAWGKYQRKQQHLSIEGDIVQTETLTLNSGLSVNVLIDSSAYEGFPPSSLLVFTDRPLTGGWFNHVRYKKFSAGVDLVFLLNHDERSLGSMGELLVKKYNTLQLSSLFFAYHVSSRRFDGELFVSSRNLIDSAIYPVSPDNKKYFGGGFKVSL
ncbi:MAG: hypothetical protein M9933_10745 [Chitinophagaceae bacterium]|nr:hypothetical protein [Chitinophagaceae bacterium]